MLEDSATAQRDISVAKVSFGFYRCDVRAVIQEYFNASGGVSCSFDPGIRGKVTIEMFDTEWETGLQQLLRMEELTYRSEGSVFEIVKRQEPPRMDLKGITRNSVDYLYSSNMDVQRVLQALFRSARTPLSLSPYVCGPLSIELKNTTFDAAVRRIAQQVNATVAIDGGIYKIVDQPKFAPDPKIRIQQASVAFVGSIEAEHSDIKQLLFTLFRHMNLSFVIGPDVQGSVTGHYSNMPLSAALGYFLGQVGAELHIESGVYVVTMKGMYWPKR
jgi:type II secretory pathway component GspD/PulD (secretin)